MKMTGHLSRKVLTALAFSFVFSANAAWSVIDATRSTPLEACKEAGIQRIGFVLPYRVAWLSPQGQSEGFYRPGFDVPGPAIPNAENYYVPHSPDSRMYCILEESSAYGLQYFPDRLTAALVLIGPNEIRPAGTGGISEITLTAKVADRATPKAGVALSFSVDVTANSGGHDHDNTSRPKGTLSTIAGTTDAIGEVKFKFKASDVAGIHTIKVDCSTCSNGPATKEVQVKVPGMVEMPTDSKSPPSYILVGPTGSHGSNHWFHPDSLNVLTKVTNSMFESGWGAVGVNDGSLIWGGLFDIKGGWVPSHSEHRTGSEVDLSVTNPRSITGLQKKKTYAELCKKENTAFSIQTLWHQDDGYPEHFHVYLGGTGLTREAGGGPCCARYKTTRVKKDKDGNPVLDGNGVPVQERVALCEETTPR